MKITFLGTGTSQGVPIIACQCKVCHSSDPRDKRLRSSVLVEVDGKTLVIDSGPDFRYQMLRASVMHLDAILYTHEHKDHTAGLDDVRAYNYVQQAPMDIYLEERVLQSIKREYAYVFAEEKYPGVPELNVHIINEHPFLIGNTEIIPIRALHYKLPLLGFRIGNFTYITDANYVSDEEKKKIEGSKYIVINSLRRETHVAHYSLSEALAFLNEFKPEKGFITHCSHQLGMYSEIAPELPVNIELAYDGLVIVDGGC